MKKKFLLVCFIGLVLGIGGVSADHSDGLGIGIIAGGGGGTVGGLFYPTLSLKVPNVPVFWGVNAFLGSGLGVGVSGDYYIFDRDLVDSGSFNLDWFLGVGAFSHFFFGDGFGLGAGVRVPVGLSLHINETFELFLDVTPGIGLGINTGSILYFVGGGELGLRVWF
ncbi:hypothetical protein FACS1894163_13730 [Spirochaetia bacterium]|nr:hypothetical protein FACS1894163_13730 [Spirochaetia bacterium]